MKESSDEFPDWEQTGGKSDPIISEFIQDFDMEEPPPNDTIMKPAGQPPEVEPSPSDTMLEPAKTFHQIEEPSSPMEIPPETKDTITTTDVETSEDILKAIQAEEKTIQNRLLLQKIAKITAATLVLVGIALGTTLILKDNTTKPQNSLNPTAKSLKFSLTPPQKNPNEETNKLVQEWQNKSIEILKELQKNGADIDHLIKLMQNHASFPRIFNDGTGKIKCEGSYKYPGNPLFRIHFLNENQDHFHSGKIIPVNGSELYAATDFKSDLWFAGKLIYELSRMYDRKLNPENQGRKSRLDARNLEIEALKAWDYNQYKEMIEGGMLIYGNKGTGELIKYIKKFFGLGDPESASKEEINYGIKICAIAIATAKLEAEYELAKEKIENEIEEDNNNDDFFGTAKTKTKAEKEAEKQKKLAELLKKYKKTLDKIQKGIMSNLIKKPKKKGKKKKK